MAKQVQDTKAIRVYGPYQHDGKMVWFVLKGKTKKPFRVKSKMLQYIDELTTDLSTEKDPWKD